jgi:hypothetical protein
MRKFCASAALMSLLVVAGSGIIDASEMPPAVQETSHGMRVAVEPRIELLAIVQHLSDYRFPSEPLITQDDTTYRQQVDAWFSRFKSDAAVRTFSEMARSGYTFSAPPTSMLFLDDRLRPRRDLVTDQFLVQRSGGAERLAKFAGELREFSRKSGFQNYFESHRAFYASLVSETIAGLDHDYISELESFYGTRNASYNVLLVPLYGFVGYGPILRTTTGQSHVYSIIGPRSVRDGRQQFGDKSYFSYMQRHEFSHSFVNPTTTRFAAEIQRVSPVMKLMDDARRHGVCGDLEECLNENIVRAVTTLLAFRDSPAEGQKALTKETRRGAALVPEILEALRGYSNARDKYPTFESYYPVLLDRLAKLPAVQQP